MIIQVEVKEINTPQEHFLAEKLMAYVDLIVENPNVLLNCTVKSMHCKKYLDLKEINK